MADKPHLSLAGGLSRVTCIGLLGLSAASGQAQALLITPGVSTIALQAEANATRSPATEVIDSDSVSQSGTLNPLAAEAEATSVVGAALVTTTARVSAAWVDAGQGSVRYEDLGWTTRNVVDGLAVTFRGLDFSYAFTIDAPAVLTVAGAVEIDPATNDPLAPFYFLFLRNLNGDGGFDTRFFAGTTRSVARNLAPGAYTLQLSNQLNLAGGLGNRTALLDADLAWSIRPADITTVPEPRTIALFGIGLAVLAAGEIRRQSSAAAKILQ
jgi:hypothetical protein